MGATLALPLESLLGSTAAGRALLAAVDAAAQRALLSLGTAASSAATDFATAAAPTAAVASHVGASDPHGDRAYAASLVAALSAIYQPLDGDLSAIAALATTPFGRGLLALADAAAVRAALSLGSAALAATGDFAAASHAHAFSSLTGIPTTLAGYGISDAQPLDGDLTALAALNGTNTLYYRSAANTWSPVTVAAGLSFAAGILSGGDAAKAVSGMWYSTQDPTTNGSAVSITANTLYLCPFRFETQETWDAIYTHVNATGTATVARLGVYEADFTTGPPTFTLLHDAGTVSVGTTGSKSITGLSRTVAAGKMVFLAILSDGTWTNLGTTGSSLRKPLLHGQSGSLNGGIVTHYIKAVTYGSLPSTVSGVSSGLANLPSSGLRIA